MEELNKSVKQETPDPLVAELEGTVPSWLKGSLYRNGPALFEHGEDRFNHLFDGEAMVHRFHIDAGKVTYQGRFVKSDSYTRNRAANRIVLSGFGTIAHRDPCKTLFDRVSSYFKPPADSGGDNTNVNVIMSGDYLYAMTETNYLRRLDPETLETVGDKVDITKLVAVNSATAHPHQDPDGTIHNLGMVFQGKPAYAIIKMKPPPQGSTDLCGSAEVVAQVPARWPLHPSHFHSFAMSENYYAVVETPFTVDVLKILASKYLHVPFFHCMKYYDGYPTKFHIIDKRTGEKVHSNLDITDDSFIVLHHINAFEEKDQLVIDLCAFTDGSVFEGASLDILQSSHADEYLTRTPRPRARRYVIPLTDMTSAPIGTNLVSLDTKATAVRTDAGTLRCSPEILTETPFELPQTNYRFYNSKRHRYVYGGGYMQVTMDSLIKLDMETREEIVWSYPDYYPSEPVFVARPGATQEDDGVLLSVVLTTGPDRHAFLLILDAASMTELARATVQVQIARDIHGIFIHDQ